MKPKDLVIPFKWDQKRIIVHDRVWYVPEVKEEADPFQFPGWSHADLFGNDRPICVEYCSGNGAWVAAKAALDATVNWVAVEQKLGRVRKIWSKVKNLSLSNLIALAGEGFQATQRYFPSESVAQVFINFPDPWPKRRHAKNRLIQDPFLNESWRILKKGGILTIVTDDESYSKWIIKHFLKNSGYQSLYPEPFYITEMVNYGTSYFEELWREKGLTIRYHQFQKI